MIKRLFSSQLRINMLASVAATVINIILLAIAYPMYLHFLGYETYGLWLILATILSFAQLGNLGITSAIIKLVAEEHGHRNTKAILNYVTAALIVLLFSGTVTLILILLFQAQIISVFKLTYQNARIVSHLLPYIAVLTVFVLLTQVINATLSGLGRMDLANCILSGGRFISVCVAFFLLSIGRGLESLLIGSTCSYIFISVISLICVHRILKVWPFSLCGCQIHQYRILIRFAGGMFGGHILNMLLSPFNKLMLSRYVGVASIPIYEIAFNGSMQVRAVTGAGLRSFVPEVSRIGANLTKHGLERIRRINYRAIQIILLCGLPVHSAIILLCEPLLKLWLRKDFTPILPPVFRIMIVGTFISLLSVPAYYTLIGLGKVKHCFYANLIQSGINIVVVIAAITLSKQLVVSDVAVATLIAMVMTSIYVLLQKHRVIKALAC